MNDFQLNITEKTMKQLMDLKKSYEEVAGCVFTESEAIQTLLVEYSQLVEMFGEVLVVICEYTEDNKEEMIEKGMSEEDFGFLRQCCDMFLIKEG